MDVVAGGLRASASIRESQKSLQNFSARAKENTRYRLFFPASKFGDDGTMDVNTASAIMREISRDVFGRSSIVYEGSELVRNPNGKFVDETNIVFMERIARILHRAECDYMKKQKEEDLEKEARLLNKNVDPVILTKALDEIETEYFGSGEGATRVNPTKRPVIGRLDVKTKTEVYAVALTAEGLPDLSNGKSFHAAWDLSSKKETQLLAIETNPDYCKNGDNYLEVGYDYLGVKKEDAGRNAAYTGIADVLSLSRNEKAKPAWDEIASKIAGLATTPEMIIARNPEVGFAITPKEAEAKFMNWLSTKTLIIANIDFESDMVKNNAASLLDYDAFNSIPSVKERLIAIVEADGAGESEDVRNEGELPEEAMKMTETSTMSQALKLDETVHNDLSGVDEL